VVEILRRRGYQVEKRESTQVNDEYIEHNSGNNFIVANFVMLKHSCRELLRKNEKYVIYEHDHKYCTSRNPGLYKDYVVPKQFIINKAFYENASSVLVQSKFHKNIVDKNLKLSNVLSLSGNMWSESILGLMERYSQFEKEEVSGIMESTISHKNAADSIRYCDLKKQKYKLIPSLPYREFLLEMASCKRLVFFPKTPETLSRIAVEARMMNLSVVTNKNLGASSEDWFKLKGSELISVMRNKRNEIADIVEGCFY